MGRFRVPRAFNRRAFQEVECRKVITHLLRSAVKLPRQSMIFSSQFPPYLILITAAYRRKGERQSSRQILWPNGYRREPDSHSPTPDAMPVRLWPQPGVKKAVAEGHSAGIAALLGWHPAARPGHRRWTGQPEPGRPAVKHSDTPINRGGSNDP
jgi:hypothetical protein